MWWYGLNSQAQAWGSDALTEQPFTNESIEILLALGEAREVWPHDPDRDADESGEWIYMALLGLNLKEHEMTFLNAISAGHTQADAARSVGRTPRWGYRFLRRLRKSLYVYYEGYKLTSR